MGNSPNSVSDIILMAFSVWNALNTSDYWELVGYSFRYARAACETVYLFFSFQSKPSAGDAMTTLCSEVMTEVERHDRENAATTYNNIVGFCRWEWLKSRFLFLDFLKIRTLFYLKLEIRNLVLFSTLCLVLGSSILHSLMTASHILPNLLAIYKVVKEPLLLVSVEACMSIWFPC